MNNELQLMISKFRVVELKSLLEFLHETKKGRKKDLVNRVLASLETSPPTPEVVQKIRELYAENNAPEFGRYVWPVPVQAAPANVRDAASAPQAPRPALVPCQPPHPALAPRQSPHPALAPQAQRPAFLRDLSVPGTSRAGVTNANQPDFSALRNRNEVLCARLNIRFKPLHFYDILDVILPETDLIGNSDITSYFPIQFLQFLLTPEQVQLIVPSRQNNEHKIQLQLRFAVTNKNGREDEVMPPRCGVFGNYVRIEIPKNVLENARRPTPCRPVNITDFCKLNDDKNSLAVFWQKCEGEVFSVSLHLVEKLNSETLLQRIRTRGIRINEITWAIIEMQMRLESDIAVITLVMGSLVCPIGKVRMATPCRSSECSHFQCFDALTFLQMNEKKEKFVCPVCDKRIAFEDLQIDGLFLKIIQTESAHCTEVQFHKNRTWSAVNNENRDPNSTKVSSWHDHLSQRKPLVELVDLDCSQK